MLLIRHVRTSKNDPLINQVELRQVNPTYAHVKYMDGRESTVSLRDLAQCPQASGQIPPLVKQSNTEALELAPFPADPAAAEIRGSSTDCEDSTTKPDSAPSPVLRHSTREISHHPSMGGRALNSRL